MYQVQKFLWCYDAIIDEMLAKPHLTKAEIGKLVGYTPQAIYIITNSDAFKRRWDERRGEMSKGLGSELTEKLTAQAEMATDALMDRIAKERYDLAPAVLLETQAGALSALGYGSKGNQTVINNVNMPLVDPEVIRAARVRGGSAPEVIEGQLG